MPLKTDKVRVYLDKAQKSRRGGAPVIYTPNIAPIFSAIISKGLCTLRELEEYYSFFDALDMFEILAVQSINETAAEGAAMSAPGARRR